MGGAILALFLALSLVGIGAGAIKAGSGMSRYSGGAARAADASPEELGRIQREAKQGMIDAVVGTAEAALNAQTAAGPGVAPNPVGIGFTEGMTIGQKIVEISEGRAQAVGAGADSNAQSSSEQGSGNSDSGDDSAGDSSEVAQDSGSSGGGEVPVAEADSDYFIAWYADNIGFKPIWITTVHEYEAYSKSMDWDCGGIDPTVELQKVAITGAYETREQAREAVGGMLTNMRTASGIYAGMPLGDLAGETHNLENIDTQGWWE